MPIHPPVLTLTDRRRHFGRECTPTSTWRQGDVRLVSVYFKTKAGTQWPVWIDYRTADAWKLVAAVLADAGYLLDGERDTGGFNCRAIAGTSIPSPHAHGTAVDIEWRQNPVSYSGRLVTNIPRELVDRILSIRTRSGAPVFRWGGDWDMDGDIGGNNPNFIDPMHFEVIASPDDLNTGLVEGAAPMAQLIPDGKTARTVQILANRLAEDRNLDISPTDPAELGIKVDGLVGPKTVVALGIIRDAYGIPRPTNAAEADPLTLSYLWAYSFPTLPEALATDDELVETWEEARARIEALELAVGTGTLSPFDATITPHP